MQSFFVMLSDGKQQFLLSRPSGANADEVGDIWVGVNDIYVIFRKTNAL
jgi:hypothetical protein